MILVDTSVWVDHLRAGEPHLASLLREDLVMSHPMVIGELACGNLRNRGEVLELLRGLPEVPVATHIEVLFFIERRHLMGRGIGFVDAHLLASAALHEQAVLWTKDRRLMGAADDLHLSYESSRLP